MTDLLDFARETAGTAKARALTSVPLLTGKQADEIRTKAGLRGEQPLLPFHDVDGALWIPLHWVRSMGSAWRDVKDTARSNPREFFGEGEMAGLEASMRADGQLVAVLVRRVSPKRVDNPIEFELIDGHRRVMAARKIGATHIKANIQTADERAAFRLAVVQDAHNLKWSAVERGNAVRQLWADMEAELREWQEAAGLDPEKPKQGMVQMDNAALRKVLDMQTNAPRWVLDALERAEKVGKRPRVSPSDVARVCNMSERQLDGLQAITNLPEHIKDMILRGEIGYSQAEALARMENTRAQTVLAKQVVEENLTARETQVRAIKARVAAAPKAEKPTQGLRRLQQKFVAAVSPKVEVPAVMPSEIYESVLMHLRRGNSELAAARVAGVPFSSDFQRDVREMARLLVENLGEAA